MKLSVMDPKTRIYCFKNSFLRIKWKFFGNFTASKSFSLFYFCRSSFFVYHFNLDTLIDGALSTPARTLRFFISLKALQFSVENLSNHLTKYVFSVFFFFYLKCAWFMLKLMLFTWVSRPSVLLSTETKEKYYFR